MLFCACLLFHFYHFSILQRVRMWRPHRLSQLPIEIKCAVTKQYCYFNNTVISEQYWGYKEIPENKISLYMDTESVSLTAIFHDFAAQLSLKSGPLLINSK